MMKCFLVTLKKQLTESLSRFSEKLHTSNFHFIGKLQTESHLDELERAHEHATLQTTYSYPSVSIFFLFINNHFSVNLKSNAG